MLGDSGGTWIGVDERLLAVGMLQSLGVAYCCDSCRHVRHGVDDEQCGGAVNTARCCENSKILSYVFCRGRIIPLQSVTLHSIFNLCVWLSFVCCTDRSGHT